jgi:hypothetical protein
METRPARTQIPRGRTTGGWALPATSKGEGDEVDSSKSVCAVRERWRRRDAREPCAGDGRNAGYSGATGAAMPRIQLASGPQSAPVPGRRNRRACERAARGLRRQRRRRRERLCRASDQWRCGRQRVCGRGREGTRQSESPPQDPQAPSPGPSFASHPKAREPASPLVASCWHAHRTRGARRSSGVRRPALGSAAPASAGRPSACSIVASTP